MGELLENHQEGGEDWGSLWIMGEERDFVLISGAVMNLLDSCSLLLILHSLRGLSGGRLGPFDWGYWVPHFSKRINDWEIKIVER